MLNITPISAFYRPATVGTGAATPVDSGPTHRIDPTNGRPYVTAPGDGPRVPMVTGPFTFTPFHPVSNGPPNPQIGDAQLGAGSNGTTNLNTAIPAAQALLNPTAAVTTPDTMTGSVAVPIQSAVSDTTPSTNGKSVLLIAGIILGLGALGFFAIKHGWFKKATKAVESAT